MKAAAPRRSALELQVKHTKKSVVSISDVEPPRPLHVTEDARGDAAGVAPASPLAGERFATVPGTAADHPDVFHFLTAVLQRPSAAEYQAQLDDPHYRPQDRLLVRRADQLVGHARLLRRSIRFGPACLPIALIRDMAMLHEYRGQGCGSALLRCAEQRMASDGALLAVLCTRAPHFFQRRGWCVAARHSFSVARPAEVLALLRERAAQRPSLLAPAEPPITIRHWRQVERDALVRLYEQNVADGYGATVRSETYWAWLLNRGAYDCIYVAIDGPDNFNLEDASNAILSYGVMRDGRLVELMTSPDRPRGGQQLLMRACSDAIEHDLPALRVDAAPPDPVHQLYADAHGDCRHPEADHGEVYLLKTLDPRGLLRQLADLLALRAQSARLSDGGLGLHLSDHRLHIAVRPEGVRIEEASPGRCYLKCGLAEFTQLVLGHLDLQAAATDGRVSPSNRSALDLASVLFPRVPLWFPPWDDLRAG